MRGIAFFLMFLASLPLIFVSPFYGVLIWYVFSLGNFHTLTWGVLDNLYYAYVIAALTCISWIISPKDKKQLPLTPLVVLTLLFSLWMTLTSCFALAPAWDVWDRWVLVHKILFMGLVGYALTTSRERVDQLVWVVVLAVGIWGVKGAISFILHGGGTVGIHGPEGGVAADNNAFGITLIMIMPLLFYQWHTAVNRNLRRGLMLMGFLVSLAIIFTYSRGALVGLCAMGVVFWLRSRAKIATGALILVVVLSVYSFAPQHWFDRMSTIETYDQDASAMSRINLWQVSLRIAELHPILGGGFRVTYWPALTNSMLEGTRIPRLDKPRAAHSIWFEVLSEQGWVGLVLFVAISGYSLYSCSWLVRRTRDRSDLAWANLLGRMGQSVLVGFWAAGTFASLAYFDEYWCVIFIFDAARRIVKKDLAMPVSTFRAAPVMGVGGVGASAATVARSGGPPIDAIAHDLRAPGAIRQGNL
jgi:probable O-glycosylation ligase (exosortase A-associated)